jgi:hypothetical protein
MNQRTLFRLFTLLLIGSLFKYLWLAGYAHPVADDFCYAAKSRGASLWAWSHSEWMYWNGRYASNLLMAQGPLSWSADLLPGYRAVPIALMAFTFLGCWFLLRRITRHAFTTGQELLGALIFLVLYLNLMPDIGEGFYWYTGAITYQLGSILFLVHLGLLFGEQFKGIAGAIVFLLNVLLAVIIVGMDEIHMLLMVGLHLGRTGWLLWRHSNGVFSALVQFIAVCAGAALMYLAPGNAVRGAMFSDTHLLFHSLGMSALQAVRFIGIWVLSPALLALSALYVPVHHMLKKRCPEMLRVSPWIAAALPVLLVMACTFPAYWSTGLLGQHRTINVACIFFVPLWFLNLSLWLERKPLREMAAMQLPPRMLGIGMLLAILSLNLTHNGFAAYVDLFGGRAANYDRVMLQREAQVRAAAQDPAIKVTFTRLTDPPRTLPHYEGRGPLSTWMIHCEARYFGAEESQVGMEEN